MKGYCFLSAVPVRREPSDRSEMVNQLLQGDTFEILEQGEKWSLVRGDYDGYEGWVDNKQWKAADGYVAETVQPVTEPVWQVAAEQYLNAPYMWGGRTVLGIDCSGLTQVCYGLCGVRLLRDASQQATQGRAVAKMTDARPGDLCFFHNAEGHIVHVGIYMGDGKIVHASGQVRIDTLTPEGIVNSETHCLTHRLHSIRRVTE